jgi:hypothetical protein
MLKPIKATFNNERILIIEFVGGNNMTQMVYVNPKGELKTTEVSYVKKVVVDDPDFLQENGWA